MTLLESSHSPDSMCSGGLGELSGLDKAPQMSATIPLPSNTYFHCQKIKQSLEGPWKYFTEEKMRTAIHVAGVSRPLKCALFLPR